MYCQTTDIHFCFGIMTVIIINNEIKSLLYFFYNYEKAKILVLASPSPRTNVCYSKEK